MKSVKRDESYLLTFSNEVRKERLSKTLHLIFGLSFEFWDMNKLNSKFFRPDSGSERLDI